VKPENTKTLVRYRIEQSQAALDDAQYLLDAKRTPVSIVNRSYYAMFYAALGLLQTVGKVPSRHSGVLSLFNQEFVLKDILPRELGRDIHRVFDLRQTSDYEVVPPLDEKMASETLQKAVGFVNAVKTYLSKEDWL
jgi:uncharacterized protein (UPF0332 family)